MSKELEPLADPGLPEHIHRKADTDPIAAKRAERQVAVLFSLSAFGTLLFIYSYFFIKEDQFIFIPIMGSTNAQQLGIGMGMAMSLLFIGFGAVHWAKTLMPDQEVTVQRHEFRSTEEDRSELVKTAKEGAAAAEGAAAGRAGSGTPEGSKGAGAAARRFGGSNSMVYVRANWPPAQLASITRSRKGSSTTRELVSRMR